MVKKGTIYPSYTVFKNLFIGHVSPPYCKYVQYNVESFTHAVLTSGVPRGGGGVFNPPPKF